MLYLRGQVLDLKTNPRILIHDGESISVAQGKNVHLIPGLDNDGTEQELIRLPGEDAVEWSRLWHEQLRPGVLLLPRFAPLRVGELMHVDLTRKGLLVCYY